MDSPQNNAAKFAFFYVLSLVALTFTAVSIGMIIFQIINKKIVDALEIYGSGYSPEALKFAISALVISAPIYFITVWLINKNLLSGALLRESDIRKWLTYFILLVSAVVMIGWFIGVINTFLNGELTLKFALKALTSIAIAATIFSYYFYDIKREEVLGAGNKVVSAYFYAALALAAVVLISSFFIVESPKEARARRHDEMVLNNFSSIDGALNNFYLKEGKLPDTLSELMESEKFVTADIIKDPLSSKEFEYQKLSDKTFSLCADFMTSNREKDDASIYDYYRQEWPHDAGNQCLEKVLSAVNTMEMPAGKPIPAPAE